MIDGLESSSTIGLVKVPYQWGPFDLQQGYSIEADALFDIPKDVKPWQFRWNPAETIFVPFHHFNVNPEETPTATPMPARPPPRP